MNEPLDPPDDPLESSITLTLGDAKVEVTYTAERYYADIVRVTIGGCFDVEPESFSTWQLDDWKESIKRHLIDEEEQSKDRP